MLYIRNLTGAEQWLVDPHTGIGRKVEPFGLARVTEELARHAVTSDPTRWQRVEAIPLGGGSGKG